ncbi:hypothetical protein SEUCBS139899_001025 [Sporothrix eucalyptigena]|uniref:U6 small nuclear RNA (adenine-(43)-N(6))-methyltransferase n=1 Tax=Sporothrix eucalyptigena TaxID=1812306 RepID=A0ABP0CQR5_9PEZI
MADKTDSGEQASAHAASTDGTDVAATPASTSSLYVVDDHQRHRRESMTQVPSSSRGVVFYRDLYTKDRIDFRALARDDPDFAAVYYPSRQLDFRDPAAIRQLTKTLLRRDFGLTVELPSDRLCPPVPNRLAYVVWVTELVSSTSAGASSVVGLDIGTGASCIYPFLACTVNPSWRFVATDIDTANLKSARANVERNSLGESIRVVTRSPDDPLVVDDEAITFTMCNPPFYASADEMTASAAAKRQPAHSACTGAPVEMVYPPKEGDDGGEVAFVCRILEESITLRDRVCWYTAMLGKLSSLHALVAQLRARSIDNYAVAAFVHGTKTRRWALGWSFGATRPTMAAARGGPDTTGLESYRHLLPPTTELDVFSLRRKAGVSLGPVVDKVMSSLPLSWEWEDKALQGVGRTRENVWGRAWRRKKQREQRGEMVEAPDKPDKDGDSVFGFVVTIRIGVTETVVHCRWLEGHDEIIYQSFCGFLKTKLKEAAASAKEEKNET